MQPSPNSYRLLPDPEFRASRIPPSIPRSFSPKNSVGVTRKWRYFLLISYISQSHAYLTGIALYPSPRQTELYILSSSSLRCASDIFRAAGILLVEASPSYSFSFSSRTLDIYISFPLRGALFSSSKTEIPPILYNIDLRWRCGGVSLCSRGIIDRLFSLRRALQGLLDWKGCWVRAGGFQGIQGGLFKRREVLEYIKVVI